jgi:hypothetical protein
MAAAYEQPSPRVTLDTLDSPDSPDGSPRLRWRRVRYATPLGMVTEPGRLAQEIAGAADRQG